MAFRIPKAPGFAQMMKDGAKHFHGLEEAVYRNITACKELAATTKSSFGPHGMNKMVINHLEKLFVTNDAATVIKELEVQHPAAKMVVLASQMCEQEVGDGTNFVLIFAGALLQHAEELLRMGLSIPEVIEGYEQAGEKALDILKDLVHREVKDLRDREEVAKSLRTAIASKQYGNEDFLAGLIANACVSILPPESLSFNVDNVRSTKILGGGVGGSKLIHGMVFQRECEGDVTKVTGANIAIYSCPFDMLATETKGTVLIKNAEELKNFSKGEENLFEKYVKEIVDSGINCIVTGGKVSDLGLHFANKYKLMIVRLQSKFDLRRLCRTVKGTALPRLTAPTPTETGHCSSVCTDEVGDTTVVVFEKAQQDRSAVCTLVLRAATDNIMDDLERAVDDGVNNFKVYTRDRQLVPGAGATEIELGKKISSFGESCPGLEQYAIQKFGQSLEVVPRALADNAGLNPTKIVSELYAAHQEDGNAAIGVDIEEGGTLNASEACIWDSYLVKYWGIRLATNAAITVLRVDQIIMAKPAGGPRAPKKQGDWDKDPDEN
ncbi:T-complex protein 1 subunit theta-like [Styela clava]